MQIDRSERGEVTLYHTRDFGGVTQAASILGLLPCCWLGNIGAWKSLGIWPRGRSYGSLWLEILGIDIGSKHLLSRILHHDIS
jgi:hypothetical protein